MGPSGRFWCFVVSLVALVVNLSSVLLHGAEVLPVVGAAAGLVGVVMAVARPRVFKGGPS